MLRLEPGCKLLILRGLSVLVLTFTLRLADLPNFGEASLGIAGADRGGKRWIALEVKVLAHQERRPKYQVELGKTNFISQNFAAVMTDDLQDLLDFLDKTRMVDGLGQLDMTKMAGTLAHGLRTRLALELSVDGAEERVVEATVAGFRFVLFHRFRVQNVTNTHALDLFGRQKAKLNLLHCLERRARVREVEVRHFRASSAMSRNVSLF